jgi:predicted SnoaL-like aldol condensation-catalyzing enzyme
MRNRIMTHQEVAIKFIETCALQSPKAAFAEFTNPEFKHHNQYFAGDRDSLMNAMIEADRLHPNKSLTVKQVYETGDRVALYSQVVKESMEIAVVHMFRFEDGKISEMWDVGQVLERSSPNQNGMF